MSTSSTMLETRFRLRSISMPCRSNPNIPRIEEELRKIKVWESSSSRKAETICVGFTGLGELYDCVEDLLKLPLTQDSIIHHEHEKWVDDVFDGTIKLLDICVTAREILSQIKENAGELRSALRRRGENSFKEEKVEAYLSSRKKMNKCINKCLEDLKRMERKVLVSSSSLLDQDYDHLNMVIRVLREVKAVTISIFENSVMAFMSEPKLTKWALVSKFIQKRQVRFVDDSVVYSLFRHDSSKDSEMQNLQMAQKSLEALESRIEGVESGFESISRRLIQTRVSLLNIFTQ